MQAKGPKSRTRGAQYLSGKRVINRGAVGDKHTVKTVKRNDI